ncbi:MAG: HlyD family efflux transporter periplasmic adaptor subunit [Synechococcaceae cyanobacterium]|nr:HlyD family efflux transporter periplasmic adaptor subunit [Synechococcaceae cyanobacterium]
MSESSPTAPAITPAEPAAPPTAAPAGPLTVRVPPTLPVLLHDDVIPPIGPWVRLASSFMVLGFAGGLALLAVMPYRVVVRGYGVVRPSGELSVINSPFEGRLRSVNVRANQRIHAGEVVVTLDTSDLSGRARESSGRLAALRAQATAHRSQARAELESAALDVDKSEAALRLAQSEYGRYRQLEASGATSAQQLEERASAVSVARSNRGKAIKVLEELRSRADTVQAEIRREMVAAQANAEQVKRDLGNTAIRSPVDGVVYRVQVRSPQQTIAVGQEIASVAPASGNLLVKVVVRSEDIGNVSPGQEGDLRVSGCPFPDYGTLPAKVISVSPDAVSSRHQESSTQGEGPGASPDPTLGMVGYEVSLVPGRRQLRSAGRVCDLRIGMDVIADIATRRESVLMFLLRKARLQVGA